MSGAECSAQRYVWGAAAVDAGRLQALYVRQGLSGPRGRGGEVRGSRRREEAFDRSGRGATCCAARKEGLDSSDQVGTRVVGDVVAW